jgi:hypothetical protein
MEQVEHFDDEISTQRAVMTNQWQKMLATLEHMKESGGIQREQQERMHRTKNHI